MVAELDSYRRGLAKGKVCGYINGELANSIELVVSIPDIMLAFKPKVKED